MTFISLQELTSRFTSLVLTGDGLPKKQKPRHILFISAILKLEQGKEYSEIEMNNQLKLWSEKYGQIFGLDHVTLRRFLVDEKYLVRDPAGNSYRFQPNNWKFEIEDTVWDVDLEEIVRQKEAEIQERKKQFDKSDNI